LYKDDSFDIWKLLDELIKQGQKTWFDAVRNNQALMVLAIELGSKALYEGMRQQALLWLGEQRRLSEKSDSK
jgi:hypothetical protein